MKDSPCFTTEKLETYFENWEELVGALKRFTESNKVLICSPKDEYKMFDPTVNVYIYKFTVHPNKDPYAEHLNKWVRSGFNLNCCPLVTSQQQQQQQDRETFYEKQTKAWKNSLQHIFQNSKKFMEICNRKHKICNKFFMKEVLAKETEHAPSGNYEIQKSKRLLCKIIQNYILLCAYACILGLLGAGFKKYKMKRQFKTFLKLIKNLIFRVGKSCRNHSQKVAV